MSWQRKLKSLKLWEFCFEGNANRQAGPLFEYWQFLKIIFYLSLDIAHCADKAILVLNAHYNEAKNRLKKTDSKASLKMFHFYIHRYV